MLRAARAARRSVTTETFERLSREARRAKRAEAQGAAAGPAAHAPAPTTTSSMGWPLMVTGSVGVGGLGWALYADPAENEVARSVQTRLRCATPPRPTPRARARPKPFDPGFPRRASRETLSLAFFSRLAQFAWLLAQLDEMASPFTAPSRAKLLPDWPLDYLQPPIPADTPCPHTLVLDMEDTLICSTWDRRYGWRHAKRPGADEFLKELSRYYEIVLFTTNMVGIGDPVMSLLDPQGLAMHRLHRDATRFVNGHHVKDLSRLNRNVKKIVLVDDDAHAAMLQPANLIRVAPYSDARDKSDKQLLELIPFLTSIVKEGVDDVPKVERRRARALARRRTPSLSVLSSHRTRAPHPGSLHTRFTPLPPFPFRSCSIPTIRTTRAASCAATERTSTRSVTARTRSARRASAASCASAPRRPTRRRRPRCAARS